MREIKFNKVICVNTEMQGHPAKNLLRQEIDRRGSWLCEKGTEKGVVTLQLECPTVITAVRIGNAHSAFVEVLVGNLGDATDKYQTLIPSSMFMNVYDSKSGNSPDRVKFFYQKDFLGSVARKEWQVVQLVCTQPFNEKVSFGVAFVRVTGLGDELGVGPEFPASRPAPVREDESRPRSGSQSEKAPEPSTSTSKPALTRTEGPPRPQGEGDRKDDRRNPPPPSTSQTKREKRPGKPFSALLADVVFAISGLKNPTRSAVREQAVRMGAEYVSDWTPRCTHLICPFANTPKYNRVKGKGRIVQKEWIESCFSDRRRYPWRRFALDKEEKRKPESEEEELPEDSESARRKSAERAVDAFAAGRTGFRSERKKSAFSGSSELSEEEEGATNQRPTRPGEYERGPGGTAEKADAAETETDGEEERETRDTTNLPMPHLSNLLAGKTFYVDRNLSDSARLERYIVAYDGTLVDKMTETVEFYVTGRGGAAVLQILRKKAPHMRAVRPAWIWEMNSKCQWISPWKFMFS